MLIWLYLSNSSWLIGDNAILLAALLASAAAAELPPPAVWPAPAPPMPPALPLFLNDIGEVGEDSGDGGGSSVKELTICCSGLTGQPPEPKFDRNH